MKFLALTAMALFIAASAHAADSSRLACDNGQVLLHVFEHRTGADERATEITVIYGGYIFNGNIEEGSPAVLETLRPSRGGNQFSGVISVDYAKGKVKVAEGELLLDGTRMPVAPKFRCKELN